MNEPPSAHVVLRAEVHGAWEGGQAETLARVPTLSPWAGGCGETAQWMLPDW